MTTLGDRFQTIRVECPSCGHATQYAARRPSDPPQAVVVVETCQPCGGGGETVFKDQRAQVIEQQQRQASEQSP